jgi:hypothetical protein
MAPLSYYWIISFIYLVVGKENFLIREISGYCHVSDRAGSRSGVFSAAQLAPIFSFPVLLIDAKKRYVYMLQSGNYELQG